MTVQYKSQLYFPLNFVGYGDKLFVCYSRKNNEWKFFPIFNSVSSYGCLFTLLFSLYVRLCVCVCVYISVCVLCNKYVLRFRGSTHNAHLKLVISFYILDGNCNNVFMIQIKKTIIYHGYRPFMWFIGIQRIEHFYDSLRFSYS